MQEDKIFQETITIMKFIKKYLFKFYFKIGKSGGQSGIRTQDLSIKSYLILRRHQ